MGDLTLVVIGFICIAVIYFTVAWVYEIRNEAKAQTKHLKEIKELLSTRLSSDNP